MAKRLTITPGAGLKKINGKWQGKFAVESAEILIAENRAAEVLQRISGLSPDELGGRAVSRKSVNKSMQTTDHKTDEINAALNEPAPALTQSLMPTEEQQLTFM